MALTVQKSSIKATEQEESMVGAGPADTYTEVSALENMGHARGDIKKLQDAGIMTADRIVMTTKKQLSNIKGLSDAKVEKIMESAQKLTNRNAFRSALDLAATRADTIMHITTGCAAFDGILGGGLETGCITEIYGEFRTGKSQLCMTVAVNCQCPVEQGGGNARAIYIDTEGTFRPERIVPIAEHVELPHEDVLENIKHARAYTADHLDSVLQHASALLCKDEYRVLIIDSIIAPFRFEYAGRGELSERQMRLGQVLRNLKKLAEEYNIAVLLTNQVMADPGNSMFIQDAKKAVGGHILSHCADTIIALRKGKGEQRVAKVIDSPSMPEAEASYQITNGGIDNYAD